MKKTLLFTILTLFLIQNMQSQCYPDRHSTNWFDAWISCLETENPNAIHGSSHWIQYDLGQIYSLSTSKLWNINDPSHLDNGVQELIIEYSIDGTSWFRLGTYTIAQATGKSNYEGTEGPDFENTVARYVLLTPISNYGGSCYGLSELKINIGEEIATIDPDIGFNTIAFPNPFLDIINIRIDTLHPGKSIEYALSDLLGRTILFDRVDEVTGTNVISLSNAELHLSKGIYIFTVYHNDERQSIKIVKE